MIIFKGQEILLHQHKGNTDYIIISFIGAGHNHEADNNFFLKPIVEKYNISCLGITSKIDNYYIHEDMKEVIALCNQIASSYQKVIVVGLCMAAYAALKYSKLLNADTVFAMCPSCTIDPKLLPVHVIASGLAKRLDEKIVTQSSLTQNDFKGKLYIAYDPTVSPDTIDARQVDYLKQLAPQAIYIPAHFTGHNTVAHLQGSQVFKSIIDALAYGTDQDVIKTVIYVRRHHINNISQKADLSIERHPLLIYKLLTSPSFAKVRYNNTLHENYPFRLKLCYSLNTQGYQQESSEYLKATLFYHLQKNCLPPNHHSLTLNPYPYFINYNGCYISYNFINRKLEAIINIAEKPFCLPLQIYKTNGKIKLICVHSGIIFELQYEDSLHFKLALPSDEYTPDHVKLSFNGYHIFIHCSNKRKYIGITPDYSVISTATSPQAWEAFTAISMVSSSEIPAPNTLFT